MHMKKANPRSLRLTSSTLTSRFWRRSLRCLYRHCCTSRWERCSIAMSSSSLHSNNSSSRRGHSWFGFTLPKTPQLSINVPLNGSACAFTSSLSSPLRNWRRSSCLACQPLTLRHHCKESSFKANRSRPLSTLVTFCWRLFHVKRPLSSTVSGRCTILSRRLTQYSLRSANCSLSRNWPSRSAMTNSTKLLKWLVDTMSLIVGIEGSGTHYRLPSLMCKPMNTKQWKML